MKQRTSQQKVCLYGLNIRFFIEGAVPLYFGLQGPLCPDICLQWVLVSALQLMLNLHTISAMLAQQNPTLREK